MVAKHISSWEREGREKKMWPIRTESKSPKFRSAYLIIEIKHSIRSWLGIDFEPYWDQYKD